MNKLIDIIINFFRWPIALYLLFSVPALVLAYNHIHFLNEKYYALGAGVAFFVFTIVMAGHEMRRSMQVISHELTHTFFAYLTLHRVAKIRLNPDGSGGSMQFKGYGNWIITLAPYFFPLFAFFYMLLMPSLVDGLDGYWLLYAILGYFLAYYWATVLSQVHVNQPDIISEGYLFSAIIIVGANLWVTGSILAYTDKLWDNVWRFAEIVNAYNLKHLKCLQDLISAYF